MTKRGRKSELWHACSRKESLVEHLEQQLASGRYSGDPDKAVSWIANQKMQLDLLQNKLQQQEV